MKPNSDTTKPKKAYCLSIAGDDEGGATVVFADTAREAKKLVYSDDYLVDGCMSEYRYNGKKVKYQGKKWKVIDVLPHGSVVLQRWMWPLPYRGVIITGLTIDDLEFA